MAGKNERQKYWNDGGDGGSRVAKRGRLMEEGGGEGIWDGGMIIMKNLAEESRFGKSLYNFSFTDGIQEF